MEIKEKEDLYSLKRRLIHSVSFQRQSISICLDLKSFQIIEASWCKARDSSLVVDSTGHKDKAAQQQVEEDKGD